MTAKDNRKSIKILYTFIQKRSFVDTDLTQLSKYFRLTPYGFPQNKKLLVPFLFVKQGLYLLFFGWKFDYFVTFFAGYHTVLTSIYARLTGKQSVIILGGTDCFKYPSFNYGNFTKKPYGLATCISAKNASLLLPVSSNLILTKSPYYDQDSIEQGIYHWCKNLKTPYKVVPTEYNPELFKRRPVPRIENSFMTIAFDIKGVSFIRKGIDKVIMIAQNFPAYQFTIVGCNIEDFPIPVSPNVKIVPPVPHHEVPAYLSAHQYYLQLSIAEGLPNAICEAMLCECIPIGSDVAAIPLAIGKNGFIVKKRRDEDILETVNTAIAYPDKETMGRNAREHIIANFGPGRRINALLEIFN